MKDVKSNKIPDARTASEQPQGAAVGEIKMPHTLDYSSPKPRDPSGFWPVLFAEIRSELAEIPLWLLLATGGMVAMLIAGFFYMMYQVSRA